MSKKSPATPNPKFHWIRTLAAIHPLWLRWFGVGLLVISASVWIGLELSQPDTFPIRRVVVEGDYPHIDKAQFQRALMPLVNTGFFSVAVEAIQDRIEQMAWIASASVRRVWPDQIVIRLDERQAIATWQGSRLLDLTGRVFPPASEQLPADIPNLSGPPGSQQRMLHDLEHFNQQLAAIKLWIIAMRLSPSWSYSIELNDGSVLVLGQREQAKRLARFVLAYPRIMADHRQGISYADLRYPNGFALRFRS